MKLIKFIVIFCLFLSACTFSGKRINLNDGDFYALVVISSNHHVSYYDDTSRDEEDNAIGTLKMPGRTHGGESPVEMTRSDERLSTHPVASLMAGVLPVIEREFSSSKIKLIPFEKVLKNRKYMTFSKNESSDENNIYYPDGFGRIDYGNSALMTSLCDELNVSGFVVIDIQFLKEQKSAGLKHPRPISAAVILTCSVYSKNSKLIWKTIEISKSKTVIEKSYEGYDHRALDKELVNCFESAAESLFSKIKLL
ncbi:MAG TPA: hypothetical protein PLV17_13145 [Spirochaetota bacterium]|nr:hypothetical protein [Spirochaetota bacterium]